MPKTDKTQKQWIALDKYDAVICKRNSAQIGGVVALNVRTCCLLVVESEQHTIAAHLTARYNPAAIISAIQGWSDNGFGTILRFRIFINDSPENISFLKKKGAFQIMMPCLQQLKSQLKAHKLFSAYPAQVFHGVPGKFIRFDLETCQASVLSAAEFKVTSLTNHPKLPPSFIHFLRRGIRSEQKGGDHRQNSLTIFTLRSLISEAKLSTLPKYLDDFVTLVRAGHSTQFKKRVTDDPILKHLLSTVDTEGNRYINHKLLWNLISNLLAQETALLTDWQAWTKHGEEESRTPEP